MVNSLLHGIVLVQQSGTKHYQDVVDAFTRSRFAQQIQNDKLDVRGICVLNGFEGSWQVVHRSGSSTTEGYKELAEIEQVLLLLEMEVVRRGVESDHVKDRAAVEPYPARKKAHCQCSGPVYARQT